MGYYKLFFEDENGQLHLRDDIQAKDTEDAINKGISHVFKLESQKGNKPFYVRSWQSDDRIVFDYGSHVGFYNLIPCGE